MASLNFGSNYNYLSERENLVKEWDLHPGYGSPFEYRFDPQTVIPKVFQEAELKQKGDVGYSSQDKSFYGVVPSNTQLFVEESVFGGFDITRLPQTDVMDVIAKKPQIFGNKFSLAKTVQAIFTNIGKIYAENGDNLGTCTLISKNLVILTRHAIEDRRIETLRVIFGMVRYDQKRAYSAKSRFDCVVEDCPESDYAIVKLKESVTCLNYVRLNVQDELLSESALLHYPLGKPLKVSVHTSIQTNHDLDYLEVFHDSDYLSSGGAYFDHLDRFTAIHLGAQLDGDRMTVCRYALPLRKIVALNPNSILAVLAKGKEFQQHALEHVQRYLEPYFRNFLIDEEGYQSKKILTRLLQNKKDKQIAKNKSGVALSKPNLEYIQKTYPEVYKAFQKACLNKVSLHKATKQFSVTGLIESDHTIPFDVWNRTTNPAMQLVVTQGGGSRKGENEMPAITIPYEVHRKLLTTGSSQESQTFRQELVDLCDENEVDEALIRCFEEYQRHGYKLTKEVVNLSLDAHAQSGVITDAQKGTIRTALGL